GEAVNEIVRLTNSVLKMVYNVQTQGYKPFEFSRVAIGGFVEHADVPVQRMKWTSDCRSRFHNGKETQPVTVL
ncbi:hypothetical protein BDY21DRAFT_291196, partial [Lineolata rhizophorae]